MSIKKQVQRFWKIFLNERKNLEHALEHNHTQELDEILKILNTYLEELCNCSMEIDISDSNYEITLLSGQDKNAQIICVLLKRMMPIELQPSWLVFPCLPPMSEKAINTVLKLEDQEYKPEDFIVYYDIDEANKCLNLSVYCEAFEHMEENKSNEVVMYLLSLFLGECALEAYINNIELVEEPQSGDSALLTHLFEVVEEIREELEWTDYSDPTTIYRLFQIQEDKLEDDVRKDIKMIFTVHPVLISELIDDIYVSYHEFYDFGGEYGYLYYKNQYNNENDALLRQQVEKVINELMYEHGIARSIGGAIGSVYSYIDLAIFDKEEFLIALEKINKQVSIPLVYTAFE